MTWGSVTPLNVFVGGPIQYALNGTNFDKAVKRSILLVIDLLREANFQVSSAHLLERFGLDTAKLNPLEVTSRDFRLMQECDLFVAVLTSVGDEGVVRTDGTHIELGWASAMGKPVIIATPQRCMSQLSHLVRGLSQITNIWFFDLDQILSRPQELLGIIDEILVQQNGNRTYQLI